SQDALLHSGDRPRVLEEVARVLRAGGHFVFTDPMAADDAPQQVLRPILERLHLDTMGTPGFYDRETARLGLSKVGFDDLSEHLPRHYGRVLEVTEEREAELAGKISEAYLTRMKTGLRNWVKGGESGSLAWGILHYRAWGGRAGAPGPRRPARRPGRRAAPAPDGPRPGAGASPSPPARDARPAARPRERRSAVSPAPRPPAAAGPAGSRPGREPGRR